MSRNICIVSKVPDSKKILCSGIYHPNEQPFSADDFEQLRQSTIKEFDSFADRVRQIDICITHYPNSTEERVLHFKLIEKKYYQVLQNLDRYIKMANEF